MSEIKIKENSKKTYNTRQKAKVIDVTCQGKLTDQKPFN